MTHGDEAQQDRRTPESLRLRSISPALTVADLDASLAWYRDVLGFTLRDTWEHEGRVTGVALVAGAAMLMLVQDDWARGRDRVKGEGLRLYLSTAQSVDEIAEGIQSRGGSLESQPADMPWGVRSFDVLDPDEYRLTVSSAG